MDHTRGRARPGSGATFRSFRERVGRAPELRRVTVALLLAGVSLAAVPVQQAAPSASLVFDGVTVVDVEQGKLVPNQRVVITGNRIQTVGSSGAVKLPKGAQVVDARGKYLIPGLWDMHMHTSSIDEANVGYQLSLATGVTGFREAHSSVPLDTLVRWRREILAGARIGPPRQLHSGLPFYELASCTNSKAACITKGKGDTARARYLVDSLKAAGADIVKTYSLSNAMHFVVAAEARRAGLLVGGHTGLPALAGADSGVGIFDHTTLNKDLSTQCFYGKAASVEQCRPIAEHFARRNTWWVPSWIHAPVAGRNRTAWIYTNFNEFLLKFQGDSASAGSLRDYLHRAMAGNDVPPPRSPFVFLSPRPSGGTTPDTAGYMYVARNAGLPILAGTDAVGGSGGLPMGFTLHAELATYVVEGLTPFEALQTATLNPAKFLRGTDSLGTVASGKLADLVLLDADPLADITNTTMIRAVVANGRYFDRTALDGLLAKVRAKAKQNP